MADTLATDEDLHFFTDLNDLENAGYTCIGIFMVADTHFVARSKPFSQFYIDLKIKDTAQIGQTYAITSEGFCNYTDENPMIQIDNTSEYIINKEILLNSDMHLTYSSIEKHKEIGETVSSNRNYTKTEYDEEGNLLSGTHSPGWNAGNSLLVVGEKASIDINIADTNKDGSIKTSYDMDNYERTVNYEIQPYVDIDGNSSNIENNENYTTVTIYSYLPKDLYYDTGSSFFNNMNLEPEIINKNSQTILKWVVPNIEIGKIVPKLTYNCTIGKAGTNQDVQNNQIITNKVTISSTGDKRATNSTFGNLSTVSFSVIKLNAIAISKTTTTPYINIGNDFDFKLKYANNSENAITNSKLYDVLPYNKDDRGSDFSGFYKINSIILDFANAPKTFDDYTNGSYTLNYTNDSNIQTSNFTTISTFSNWSEGSTKAINAINKTVTYTGFPENVKALLFNISLQGFEYIEITLNMSPTGNQQEGDIYINDFYQYSNGQVEQVHSNPAVVQVYGTLNVTKIWNDHNNFYETRPNSINISLLQNGNVYRVLTLDTNDAVSANNNKWCEIAKEIPIYDSNGNAYVYTIIENENDPNLQYYYNPPYYNQDTLTVTNTGIWLQIKPDSLEPIIHKIIINKDIINANGSTVIANNFKKLNLNPTATYSFPIVLKQLNRTLSKDETTMIETYNGYSGKIFNGIVTNKNTLTFFNIEAGKYEISEEAVQHFDFVEFTKLNSSDGVTFSKEDDKYYITISGLTETDEYIEVKVTNRINSERFYNNTNSEINIFKVRNPLLES